jgi:hypothetical protein
VYVQEAPQAHRPDVAKTRPLGRANCCEGKELCMCCWDASLSSDVCIWLIAEPLLGVADRQKDAPLAMWLMTPFHPLPTFD